MDGRHLHFFLFLFISSFVAIVKMYEHKLKELNPEIEHITYDINDLYNYIDGLHDICGLMYLLSHPHLSLPFSHHPTPSFLSCNPETNAYEPKGRDWIKAKIFQQLKQQAA